MPGIIKWNPINDIFVLDEMLDQMLGWPSEGMHTKKPEKNSAWTPAADIYETDDAIILRVELAGVEKDTLEIVLHDGHLVLRGNRPFTPHVQPSKIHRIERSYGSFQRTFEIPKPVDVRHVSAVYEQGFLTVTLAKLSHPASDRLTIPVKFE
jgi:HSP20 family protein